MLGRILKKKSKSVAEDQAKFLVVYRTLDDRTEMYTVQTPSHELEFGNTQEGKSVVGFRSYCLNRGGYRSFRYDRINSMVRV